MKNLCRVFCLVISLVIMLANVASVSALEHVTAGDVDSDGQVTVRDATIIQKSLASLVELSIRSQFVGDVDSDGYLTVRDATQIQKYLAGFGLSFEKKEINLEIELRSFNSSYISGYAMTGVPVTFNVNDMNSDDTLRYRYYVDGDPICQLQDSSSIEYIFDEPGTYTVSVAIYSMYDTCLTGSIKYTVVEPYRSNIPVISCFYHDRNVCGISPGEPVTFTAGATQGAGNYTYSFYVDGEKYQNFSADNTLTLEDGLEEGVHKVTVLVRDSSTGMGYVALEMEVTSSQR
ncbi:MAG: hypothetical protein IJV88_04815 [Ruminococcus sp.]|nr:hypothetical protein [Ruminococcus sp.]